MKLLLAFIFILVSVRVMAFDMKGFLEKAAKDKKMQAQAKEYAQKGYEYFKGNKEEEKVDETKAEAEKSPEVKPTI